MVCRSHGPNLLLKKMFGCLVPVLTETESKLLGLEQRSDVV